MAPTNDENNQLPALTTNGRMHVYLNDNYFVQNKAIIPNNNNVIIIYCVYQLVQYHQVEILRIQFKMLYMEQYKLLKMVIPQNIHTKDMAYVLMKMVCLVKGLLTTEKPY